MSDHNCAEQMHWHLNLQHFGDTNIKYLEVSGSCKVCGRQAAFRGSLGLNPAEPTVSVDQAGAVFPFVYAGEEYDGKGIGYSVSLGGSN